MLINVSPCDDLHALRLQVQGAAPADLFDLVTTTRRVLDLNADPAQILSALGGVPVIGPLVRARPGIRLVGTWSPFEAAIRAVLGGFEGGPRFRAAAAHLVECCGRTVCAREPGLTHLFPSPADVARAELAHLGIKPEKPIMLHELACAFAAKAADDALTLETIVEHFARYPGLDEASAHYVALRGLGEPDAYPALDRCVEHPYPDWNDDWRPWRGYVAFHLWFAVHQAASAALRTATRPVVDL
jgi:AraC family transcriptional regulator of adaptative response / DNA-3-methyladenine glycosylase II